MRLDLKPPKIGDNRLLQAGLFPASREVVDRLYEYTSTDGGEIGTHGGDYLNGFSDTCKDISRQKHCRHSIILTSPSRVACERVHRKSWKLTITLDDNCVVNPRPS